MRPWFILGLCLPLAAGAADDLVVRLRRALTASPSVVKWANFNGQAVKQVWVEYGGPGRVHVRRAWPGAKDLEAFDVKVMDLVRLPLDQPLRVKSTSCHGVPRTLHCRLAVTTASLTVGLFPAGAERPVRTQDFDSRRILPVTLAKHFPELVSSPLTLTCDEWSWARNEASGRVEVIELSSVEDRRAVDVDSQQRAQLGVHGDFTCAADPGTACVLRDDDTYGGNADLMFAESFALELNRGRSCTVEFEPLQKLTADSTFSYIRALGQRDRIVPAVHRAFQPRLTEAFLTDWQDDQVREGVTKVRQGYSDATRLQFAFATGWLELLDVLTYSFSGVSGQRGTFTVSDTIDEGDRR